MRQKKIQSDLFLIYICLYTRNYVESFCAVLTFRHNTYNVFILSDI